MNRDQLQIVVNRVFPRIYKFAVAISPDQLMAEQVLIDSLTVYLLENKDFLDSENIDLEDSEQRASFVRYITEQLLFEIYFLMNKKAVLSKGLHSAFTPEYEDFNQLSCQERSILYLKEIEGFSIAKLQTLFSFKFHEIMQVYHNAKSKLLSNVNKDFELDNFMEQVSNSRNFHLISSVVYDTCKQEQKERVARMLVSDKDLREYFEIKQNERNFLKQLIPDISFKKSDLALLRRELTAVITDLYPEGHRGFFGKIKKVLNKPIMRIEL